MRDLRRTDAQVSDGRLPDEGAGGGEPQGARLPLTAAPLGLAEFSALVEALEPPPRVAVAVSGGRDSLALTLLARDWARARSGDLLALVVDHGLRRESGAEADRVGRWLAAACVPHRILRWNGEKPATGVQAAAREARYALLLEACRDAGMDALLLGHQLEDQAETFLMRLARGGGDGLAAMAPAIRRDGIRLLRPLLGVPRARLAATLQARGQSWLDDPSNEDPRFERTRMRTLVAEIGAERLASAADAARRARSALDAEAAALAARSVALHPAGWATVDPASLGGGLAAARALRRLLHAVGGADFAPPMRAAEAVLAELGRRGRTLGFCRILPWRGRALVCRESRGIPPAVAVRPGLRANWDRFAVELEATAPPGLTFGALGADRPEPVLAVPGAARPTLPCLRLGPRIVALPGLGGPPPPWLGRVALRRAESGLELPNQRRSLS